ncbi:hypothetical protein [cf. Phormidesmis sp. LEGE 11477]|uniref:hypothetical protein n=1 Tax=cf. Phormidesmis sp. LEGE 11477 TaxID=1828680 RepID=UPI001D136480|nr:hypothetical protein [cf. Phormidesmis sp. LEGE 11477]
MSIRPLENLWNFALDNPEISIAIVTALSGGLTWLFRTYQKPVRDWLHSRKVRKGRTNGRDSGKKPKTPPSPQNWFVNVGEHRGHLKWEDCVRYGCISAGGGARYRRALQKLKLGDTVYAYITGSGYVGAGKVSSIAVPIDKFITQPHNTPLVKRELATTNINNQLNKLDTDWVAGIAWSKIFDRENASRKTEHYITTACEIQDDKRLASLRKTFGT